MYYYDNKIHYFYDNNHDHDIDNASFYSGLWFIQSPLSP
jgi:hypothetical protein